MSANLSCDTELSTNTHMSRSSAKPDGRLNVIALLSGTEVTGVEGGDSMQGNNDVL